MSRPMDEAAKVLTDPKAFADEDRLQSALAHLRATAPVLAHIVDEAIVQDGYMNALTDGFGEK